MEGGGFLVADEVMRGGLIDLIHWNGWERI